MHDESAAWNAEAHEWVDRIREGMGGRVHAHDASLYGLLPPPSGLTLDVGCGEGRISRELRARGYDVARIDALPVDDGAARLVVCVNVLPHIHDLESAARELARVLGPGGSLLIGTIHPVAQAGTFDEEAGELRLRGYFTHDAHAVPLGDHHVFHQHRTIEDYVRTLLAVGLTLTDLREVAGPSGEVPLYLDLLLTR